MKVPELTEELKIKILADKGEVERLNIKAHWALIELSDYYKQNGDSRLYKINGLILQLGKLF